LHAPERRARCCWFPRPPGGREASPRAFPSASSGAADSGASGRRRRTRWNAEKDVETVEIVTTDEDGSARDTTIWLAVVDGQGYIRTGNSTWKGNIERNPDVTLRVGETEYAVRAEFVTDADLKTRVEQTLREKYGFSDSFIGIFRIGEPNIMRLVPR
jgi:hypothetical protein